MCDIVVRQQCKICCTSFINFMSWLSSTCHIVCTSCVWVVLKYFAKCTCCPKQSYASHSVNVDLVTIIWFLIRSRGSVVEATDLHSVTLVQLPLIPVWVIDSGRKDIRPELLPCGSRSPMLVCEYLGVWVPWYVSTLVYECLGMWVPWYACPSPWIRESTMLNSDVFLLTIMLLSRFWNSY